MACALGGRSCDRCGGCTEKHSCYFNCVGHGDSVDVHEAMVIVSQGGQPMEYLEWAERGAAPYPTVWHRFDGGELWSPSQWLRRIYRRTRPKLSRVEEMAREFRPNAPEAEWPRVAEAIRYGICAVVAMLRNEPGTNQLAEDTARCIERAFLGRR